MPDKIVSRENLKAFREKLDDKYVIEGEYSPSTSVGLSDQADSLTPYGPNSGVYETQPFVFQSSGGSSDIGVRAYLKSLRGNSVAWNQLVQNGNFVDTSNWYTTSNLYTAISVSNNIASLTKNASGNGLVCYKANDGISYQTHHKLLAIAKIKPSRACKMGFRVSSYQPKQDLVANVWNTLIYLYEPTSLSGIYFGIEEGDNLLQVNDTVEIKEVQLFDLTLMFGAGKEPTSVLEFNRLFPLPYYDYNAGTLLSCKSNGYKTVGYNAFDGQWEAGSIIQADGIEYPSNNAIRSNYIKVICGQNYTFEWNTALSPSEAYWFYYDVDKNYIGYRYFGNTGNATIPQNCSYIRLEFIKTGWGTNIPTDLNACLHLTWDSARTGYEPYKSETYALPNVELRSAGAVYDELKPDGTLIRRVGSYTFTGNENWLDYDGGGYSLTTVISGMKSYESSELANIKWALGITIKAGSRSPSLPEYTICVNPTGRLFVMTTKNATQLNSALAGKTIYFELVTPTEEQTSNTFQEVTPIDDFGTQEFLSSDSIVIPQGNEFFYPVDYKAFIDSLGGRDDIEYDASQIVSQAQLGVVGNRIPPLSSNAEDGTYTLKATKSGSTITYSWVVDE